MIKAILFDASGVLHVANTAVGDDIQQELGLNNEQVTDLFNNFMPLMGKGLLSEKVLWAELKEKYGIRHVDPSEHLFSRKFEETLEKMPGMYELVNELQTAGYMTALLTNVTPQFAEVLERKGHYKPFAYKILSFEIGKWKPEVSFFTHALEILNLAPNEVIFIDDQKRNVIAAEGVGIKSLQYRDTANLKEELAELIEF